MAGEKNFESFLENTSRNAGIFRVVVSKLRHLKLTTANPPAHAYRQEFGRWEKQSGMGGSTLPLGSESRRRELMMRISSLMEKYFNGLLELFSMV